MGNDPLTQIIVDYENQHAEETADEFKGCDCDICIAARRVLAEGIGKRSQPQEEEQGLGRCGRCGAALIDADPEGQPMIVCPNCPGSGLADGLKCGGDGTLYQFTPEGPNCSEPVPCPGCPDCQHVESREDRLEAALRVLATPRGRRRRYDYADPHLRAMAIRTRSDQEIAQAALDGRTDENGTVVREALHKKEDD